MHAVQPNNAMLRDMVEDHVHPDARQDVYRQLRLEREFQAFTVQQEFLHGLAGHRSPDPSGDPRIPNSDGYRELAALTPDELRAEVMRRYNIPASSIPDGVLTTDPDTIIGQARTAIAESTHPDPAQRQEGGLVGPLTQHVADTHGIDLDALRQRQTQTSFPDLNGPGTPSGQPGPGQPSGTSPQPGPDPVAQPDASQQDGIGTREAEQGSPPDPDDPYRHDVPPEHFDGVDPEQRGPLGDKYQEGVTDAHDGTDEGFDPKERDFANQRADEGRHVTRTPRHPEFNNGYKSMEALERTGPEDPGTAVEYKSVGRDSRAAVDSQLTRALDKFDPQPDQSRLEGDVALDGRNAENKDPDQPDGLSYEHAVNSLKARFGRMLSDPNETRLDQVGKIEIYLGDGSRVVYHDGRITHETDAGTTVVGEWDATAGRFVSPTPDGGGPTPPAPGTPGAATTPPAGAATTPPAGDATTPPAGDATTPPAGDGTRSDGGTRSEDGTRAEDGTRGDDGTRSEDGTRDQDGSTPDELELEQDGGTPDAQDGTPDARTIEQRYVDALTSDQRQTMEAALTAARPVAEQMRSDLKQVADALAAEFGDGSVRVEGDGKKDVKKLASLARKYLIEGRREGSFGDFMADVNDLARFSLSVLDGPRYTEIVQAALARLQAEPYNYRYDPADDKSFWRPGNRFLGRNITLLSPDGHKIELQFPTGESFAVGDTTHGDYEIFRLEGRDPVTGQEFPVHERAQAFLRILRANQGVTEPVPGGVDPAQSKNTSFAKWIASRPQQWAEYQQWLADQGRTFEDEVRQHGLTRADFPIDPKLIPADPAVPEKGKLDERTLHLLRSLPPGPDHTGGPAGGGTGGPGTAPSGSGVGSPGRGLDGSTGLPGRDADQSGLRGPAPDSGPVDGRADRPGDPGNAAADRGGATGDRGSGGGGVRPEVGPGGQLGPLTDPGALAPGVPSLDTTRTTGPDHLGPIEDPQFQADIEQSLDTGSGYQTGADPSTHPYGRLVNDGGPNMPGRNNNCLDSSLAALSSFYGDPRVSAPRWPDVLPDGTPDTTSGEADGVDRAENWLGGTWDGPSSPMPGDPAGRAAAVAGQYADLHAQIAAAGPGASALVIADWLDFDSATGQVSTDANGDVVPSTSSHAFVIVYPHGASGPVWWDPQHGQTWTSPPTHYMADTHTLWSMRGDSLGAPPPRPRHPRPAPRRLRPRDPPPTSRERPMTPQEPQITEDEARTLISRLIGAGREVTLLQFESGWLARVVLTDEERSRGMQLGQGSYIIDRNGTVTVQSSLSTRILMAQYSEAKREGRLTGRQIWPEPTTPPR
ncbi:toxin glutamine deamidase domain-containing protein [Phytohabitans flavus]|uniref:toxin glutamine deamidase domain-containing protein n=1 Tax=Phytohabitans flavus TaxID=1076124 RepID=UPI003633686F